jgi:hypothetical protein
MHNNWSPLSCSTIHFSFILFSLMSQQTQFTTLRGFVPLFRQHFSFVFLYFTMIIYLVKLNPKFWTALKIILLYSNNNLLCNLCSYKPPKWLSSPCLHTKLETLPSHRQTCFTFVHVAHPLSLNLALFLSPSPSHLLTLTIDGCFFCLHEGVLKFSLNLIRMRWWAL